MNNTTPSKIVNAIMKSKFACTCVDNDYAFDIVVEGVKLEIRPCRWSYCDGGAVAHANGWRESENIEFDINLK